MWKDKDEIETHTVWLSKCATVDGLTKKICRLLSTYCYMVLKNKSAIISKVHLWKYNGELQALKEIDSKTANYTHVKIDAEILNV